MIILVEINKSNSTYKEIRNRHYVTNRGCIGRQIHYLIFDSEEFGTRPIGVISGASPVWACKPRDQYFGITKENRVHKLDEIINNTVFRLEKTVKNLASQTLALWRKQITKDWYGKYGFKIKGFETFIFGENRTGGIYKADNWKFVGITQGSKFRSRIRRYTNNTPIRSGEQKKLIFCK